MKTCNFYWSNTPMAWIRYLTLESFRYYNPDWKINLWTSNVSKKEPWKRYHPQDAFHYNGNDYRDRLKILDIDILEFKENILLPGNTTGDMCRWNVLSNGGIFADLDIIFTAPMPEINYEFDGLSHNGLFFRLGLAYGKKNGFFVNILEYANNKIKYDMLCDSYQTLGVNVIYEFLNCQPKYAMFKLREMKNYHISNIPMDWVHPLQPEEIQSVSCPTINTFGLHWYAGYPPHRWHVDNLTEVTIEEYKDKDELTKLCWQTYQPLTLYKNNDIIYT